MDQFYKTINEPWDKLPSKPSLEVKIQSKRKDEEVDTMIFNINGRSIDHSVVNALRRTMMSDVPIYAFHRSSIKVDKNTSLLNDDEIYNIFETIPIFDVDNPYDLENPELYLSSDVLRKLFSTYLPLKYNDLEELEREKVEPVRTEASNTHKKEIEFRFDMSNHTNDTINVTTHDGTLLINGKVANNYKNRPPCLLLKLKPKQDFVCTMVALLAIPKMSSIWDGVGLCFYNKINENEYKFNFQSLGQIPTNEIMKKSCYILSRKLNNLSQFLREEYLSKEIKQEEEIKITLYQEDHTLGNLLATALQKSSKVAKAGYSQPHLLEMQILVAYILMENVKDHPIQVMIDIVDYLNGVFKLIGQQI
jgi:DNA-directed RNA polymerase subunit L